MRHRSFFSIVLIILAALVLSSVGFAFATNIVVPTTHLTNTAMPITINTLKPTACSAILLTAIIYCPATGGACDGTNANELILGTPNVDTIQGKGGSDCILGGGGNDDISGSQANDVCIGGAGTDTFKKCETSIQ